MAHGESSTAEQERRQPVGLEGSLAKHWKLLVLAVVVIGLFVAGQFLPLRQWFTDTLEWVRGHGAWAPAIVVGIYVAATIVLLPGSILTLGSGILFGLLWGTVITSIGSTLGACAAFLIGRHFARGWVEGKVQGDRRFSAIDEAVGGQGFKIVLLTRLSPVFPFVLLNYAFSLTKVPFWKYALASWVGMLPGTVMYVYVGSVLGELARLETGQRDRTLAERIFFYVGLAVAIVVAVMITRIARKALKQAVPDESVVEERPEDCQ